MKKVKRIDNPLFENTLQKAATAEKKTRSAGRTDKKAQERTGTAMVEKKIAVKKPALPKPVLEHEAGRSIDELRKMKDEIKIRLSSIEKDSDNLTHMGKRFLFMNDFEGSAEVDDIQSDADVVAEWGIAPAEKKPEIAKSEEGNGDIFHVIRELERQLESTDTLNESLEIDVAESRRELARLKSENEEQAKKINSLEESATLSEDLLEKLAISEEEKNKALRRKADIESELEFIIAEKRTLESDLHDSKMKFRDVDKENLNIRSEIELYKEKNNLLEEIQNDLSYTIARKDNDLEKVAMLESELNALSTTREALELDLRTAQKIIARFKEEKETIETRLAYLEENKTHIENKLAASNEENKNSNDRVQELARELGATRALKNNLETECSILKKTIEEIHGALVFTKHKASRRQAAPAE